MKVSGKRVESKMIFWLFGMSESERKEWCISFWMSQIPLYIIYKRMMSAGTK